MTQVTSAIGSILDASTHQTQGTGFVILDAKGKALVVTCFHVAHENGRVYQAAAPSLKIYKLTFKFAVPEEDVAVFSPESDIPTQGLKIARENRLSVGDPIIYAGYKVQTQGYEINAAQIVATGTGRTVGGTADFLEFYGEGKPGFSGGPVMTSKGEVIGIFTSAWAERGYQPGAQEMDMNKAVLFKEARNKFSSGK